MAAQTKKKINMSKRYGHLIERIIERSNMDRAFDEVVDQLPEAKIVYYRDGRVIFPDKNQYSRREYYRKRREDIIKGLTEKIGNGTFRVGKVQEMEVRDGPKDRIVQSPCVKDRIGCNAVMRIVEEVLYPSVVKTSAASIPGRGMHKLFCKMRRDIENDRDGTCFFYKCDIKKFYESIIQDLMWECVKDKIKDPVLLPILENFVRLMPKGLSIGLRSSQCYGNIFLSDIDHFIKDDLGVKYYYRFCDDIVILGKSKTWLWMIRDLIHEKADEKGLTIKPNETVKPLSEGIDFLGYVYDGKKARIRKRTKQKAARRLHEVKSRRRRQEIIGSLKGMAKWGDCKNLYKKLTGKNMTDIGEVEVAITYSDGKKRFKGAEIKPRELEKRPFVVVDFERDVIPRWDLDRYEREVKEAKGDTTHVAPAKPKYVASIIYEGKPRKIWTGLEDNKVRLEKMAELGKFPFFSSIEVDYSGKYPRYTFCSATALGHTPPSDEEIENIVKQFGLSIYKNN